MFDQLSTEAVQTVKSLYGLSDISPDWSRPQDPAHGDLTTTIALRIAKTVGTSPRDIAEKLADALRTSSSIEKAEVAGAGYVNLWLKPAVLIEALESTRTHCSPRKVNKKDAPIIIEGSDPNIAKPLGVHHILSTIIGQSLVNFYRYAGFPVISWNYIGDWGTQFGALAVAVEKWGKKKTTKDYSIDELLELYVKFHEEAEKDAALQEEGRAAFRKLEQGDRKLHAFWADVVMITKASLSPIYERLQVTYDLDLGESFYNDKMDTLLEEGKKKGVFKEGEGGSLIATFSEETGFPPYLVQKGDGATLYSTRDLAQMRYRIDTYHPQKILIPTDISQKLHFEQLIATCQQLSWDLPAFENVLFGRMRFADKKMSTRKGNILKLEEVLDEAVKRAQEIITERGDSIQTDNPQELAEMMGIGALVYGILSQNRKMDMVFDWDKMLSFEGNSAPYLQYTHARARSIMRKAKQKSAAMPAEVLELTGKERTLLRLLLEFAGVLEDARTEHLPHKLANYLFQLCQEFNGFYSSEPILTAEGERKDVRLALTDLTSSVLKSGAQILTLRVPERM